MQAECSGVSLKSVSQSVKVRFLFALQTAGCAQVHLFRFENTCRIRPINLLDQKNCKTAGHHGEMKSSFLNTLQKHAHTDTLFCARLPARIEKRFSCARKAQVRKIWVIFTSRIHKKSLLIAILGVFTPRLLISGGFPAPEC